VVRALLEAHADLNHATSDDGRTALIQAAQNGHIEVVRALLEAHADPQHRMFDGATALDASVALRHHAVTFSLLQTGGCCGKSGALAFYHQPWPLRSFERLTWLVPTAERRAATIGAFSALGANVDPLTLKILPLEIAPDAYLAWGCLVTARADQERVSVCLIFGSGMTAPLRFESDALYHAVSGIRLSLTPSTLMQYVRAFLALVIGTRGAFEIVESADDVLWTVGTPDEVREEVSKEIATLEYVGFIDGRHRLFASVLFKKHLFRTAIWVARDGQLEMTDERLVGKEEPLPVEDIGAVRNGDSGGDGETSLKEIVERLAKDSLNSPENPWPAYHWVPGEWLNIDSDTALLWMQLLSSLRESGIPPWARSILPQRMRARHLLCLPGMHLVEIMLRMPKDRTMPDLASLVLHSERLLVPLMPDPGLFDQIVAQLQPRRSEQASLEELAYLFILLGGHGLGEPVRIVTSADDIPWTSQVTARVRNAATAAARSVHTTLAASGHALDVRLCWIADGKLFGRIVRISFDNQQIGFASEPEIIIPDLPARRDVILPPLFWGTERENG
jgi:hypothetical protein